MHTNHWLKLKLVGVKANRPAIGARLKISLQTHGAPREPYRTVSSGGSFGSNPLTQEIGLGNSTSITAVEIRWPGSDAREMVKGLEMNHSYQIREGEPNAVLLKLHPVNLDHCGAGHVASAGVNERNEGK